MYGLKLNLFNFKTAKYQKKNKVGYRNKYRKYSWRRNWNDRISDLPDDILVSILSLLPDTEAVATCVLSHRWEKLWTFTTGTLSFSNPKWLMVKTKSDEDKIKPEFINWVNHALRVHQGPAIQEFSIEFGLDEFSTSDIDTWINFAIGKKVQRLHFDFLRAYNDHDSEQRDYNFPNLNLLRSPANGFKFNSFINSLTELSLACLNVDESLLQYFLSNCPNLEKLCLESSCSLVNLRVAAPLKLKHLEISYCYNLKNIEIAAPNLVFLKYMGETKRVTLKNVPKLAEAHMGDGYAEYLITHIPDHLGFLSQLEELTLEDIYLRPRWRIRRIPKLLNLKRLVLIVCAGDDESLLPCTHLLKAAPFLHTFVMKLSIYHNKEENIREVCKAAKYRHQYLKVVKLSGFSGLPIDVEIASHLLEAAISLEKITIHTKYAENRLEAKERAKQLKEKLPAGAELVVLQF